MKIHSLYDKATNTFTYVVYEQIGGPAVVIDPVLDYDPASSRVSTESWQILNDFIEGQRLTVQWLLETHVHADHMTSAWFLRRQWKGSRLGISAKIVDVQKTFQKLYQLDQFTADGSHFDHLFQDGETIKCGDLTIRVLTTPGHTPACLSYLIGDAVFTGDALFMPDSGTGRCDFPGGDASSLYDSIQKKLYTLPLATRTFAGHDYQPGGRGVMSESTIETQRSTNIQLRVQTSKEEYVRFRQERDRSLSAPRLLLPSLQVNMCGGQLPPEVSGKRYLKIPLNLNSTLEQALVVR